MWLHCKVKLQASDAMGLIQNMHLPLEPKNQIVMVRFAAVLRFVSNEWFFIS